MSGPIRTTLPWKLQTNFALRVIFRFLHNRGNVRFIWNTDASTSRIVFVRYILAYTKYFEVYLHQFVNDEDHYFHDHSWNFVTFLIRGEYLEEFADNKEVLRRAPSVAVRAAVVRHRIRLNDGKNLPVTLVVTGPRRRDWKFFDMHDGTTVQVDSVRQQTGQDTLGDCRQQAHG